MLSITTPVVVLDSEKIPIYRARSKIEIPLDLYEYEVDHVLLGEYNGPVVLNPEEASDYKWISLDELSRDILENPTKYSHWFIISAPNVIEYIKNNC